jgi:hypothetical protein
MSKPLQYATNNSRKLVVYSLQNQCRQFDACEGVPSFKLGVAWYVVMFVCVTLSGATVRRAYSTKLRLQTDNDCVPQHAKWGILSSEPSRAMYWRRVSLC